MAVEEATFAEGCFWQVEIDFANTPGVLSTEVGYTGGKIDSPSYEEVCNGRTGHAEAVHLTFDPDEVSYAQLLDVFFETVVGHWRGTVVGVLLTGMGADGALGLKALRDKGHHTIAQDKASSVLEIPQNRNTRCGHLVRR